MAPSGGSKSRLAKAVGAEPSGRMRDEKCKTPRARSTFGSQDVQNNSGFGALLAGELLKMCMRLRREAYFEVKMVKAHHCPRSCGAKHISKPKC